MLTFSIPKSLRIQPAIMQRRFSSSQPPPPTSPHVGFYKTFARPIAKVLLMATFTYQVAYWGWVKLEKDEIKRIRSGEIKGLEGELERLTQGKVKLGERKP